MIVSLPTERQGQTGSQGVVRSGGRHLLLRSDPGVLAGMQFFGGTDLSVTSVPQPRAPPREEPDKLATRPMPSFTTVGTSLVLTSYS